MTRSCVTLIGRLNYPSKTLQQIPQKYIRYTEEPFFLVEFLYVEEASMADVFGDIYRAMIKL
jgi:hypothetical protein